MVTVGVLATFEFTPGSDAAVERFFREGQHVVEGQPATTQWFAFRLGATTYGAFAVFASDEDREALLSAGGPRAARNNADLFERAPSFEKVEIVAARTADLGGRGGAPANLRKPSDRPTDRPARSARQTGETSSTSPCCTATSRT